MKIKLSDLREMIKESAKNIIESKKIAPGTSSERYNDMGDALKKYVQSVVGKDFYVSTWDSDIVIQPDDEKFLSKIDKTTSDRIISDRDPEEYGTIRRRKHYGYNYDESGEGSQLTDDEKTNYVNDKVFEFLEKLKNNESVVKNISKAAKHFGFSVEKIILAHDYDYDAIKIVINPIEESEYSHLGTEYPGPKTDPLSMTDYSRYSTGSGRRHVSSTENPDLGSQDLTEVRKIIQSAIKGVLKK